MMLSNNHNLTAAFMIALSLSIAGVANGATGRAFVTSHCLKCHDAEQHKGDIRLVQLDLPVTDANHELWEEVVHNIQRGDMPPKDARQPAEDERRAFLAVAIPLLTRYEADLKRSRDPLIRLTNNQIAHSLQDLLHTDQHIAHELIADPVDKHGYSRQTGFCLVFGELHRLPSSSASRTAGRRSFQGTEPVSSRRRFATGTDHRIGHLAEAADQRGIRDDDYSHG